MEPDVTAVDGLVLHVHPEVMVEGPGATRMLGGGVIDPVEANGRDP